MSEPPVTQQQQQQQPEIPQDVSQQQQGQSQSSQSSQSQPQPQSSQSSQSQPQPQSQQDSANSATYDYSKMTPEMQQYMMQYYQYAQYYQYMAAAAAANTSSTEGAATGATTGSNEASQTSTTAAAQPAPAAAPGTTEGVQPNIYEEWAKTLEEYNQVSSGYAEVQRQEQLLNAQYSQGFQPDEPKAERSLWIGGIPPSARQMDIDNLFNKYGPIDVIRMNAMKACAFVKFRDRESTLNAYNNTYGTASIHGHPVRVGWAKNDAADDESPVSSTAWIGNMDPFTMESEIRELFAPYGNILQVRMLPEKKCAFVSFPDQDCVRKAKNALNGYVLRSRTLKVGYGKSTHIEMPSVFIKQEELPILHPAGPDPPQEVASIIDRFADLVIKNGRELEQRGINAITEKTRFLLEGDQYHNYYKWRVYEKWPGKETALEPVTKHRVSRWGQQAPMQPAPIPEAPKHPIQMTLSYPSQPQPQQPLPPPPPPSKHHSPPPPPPSSSKYYSHHHHHQSSSSSSSSSSSMPPKKSQKSNDDSYYSMSSAFGSKIMTMNDQAELVSMINALTPVKSSISKAREWVSRRRDLASCIVECLLRNIQDSDRDFKKQLSILYLINDVLLSDDYRYFKDPFNKTLSKMFSSILKGVGDNAENKTKVADVLRAWSKRDVYPRDTILSYLRMFDSSAQLPPQSSSSSELPASTSSAQTASKDEASSSSTTAESERKRSRSSRRSRSSKRSRSKTSYKRRREESSSGSSESGSESGSSSSSSGGSSSSSSDSGSSSGNDDKKDSKRGKSGRKHRHHRHHHSRLSKHGKA